MTREELIEKARRFEYPLNDTNWGQCVAEAMADFALSLQEPESKPWPQEGDVAWLRAGDGDVERATHLPAWSGYLKQGRIHRTEAEAIRANEVEAANAAIKRWRDENAPFVADFTKGNQSKYYGIYNHEDSVWGSDCWSFTEVPNGIPFASHDDLTRCQSEIPDAWAALVGVK